MSQMCPFSDNNTTKLFVGTFNDQHGTTDHERLFTKGMKTLKGPFISRGPAQSERKNAVFCGNVV